MKKQKGFTLLEIMLVIVVIGYLVTLIEFPTLEKDPFEQTELEAKKLSTLINLASEYAVLNNVQMGVAITETSYTFLAFIDDGWQRVEEPPFVASQLEQDFRLELNLDGLAWQEENLLSAVEFIDADKQEALSELPEEERLTAFPQIFLLSSGELTPFDLEVIYDNGFDNPVSFLIRGKFITPVDMYDPQQQLELD